MGLVLNQFRFQLFQRFTLGFGEKFEEYEEADKCDKAKDQKGCGAA